MDGPPENDCCSVCQEELNTPCQANCSHWFCRQTSVVEFKNPLMELKRVSKGNDDVEEERYQQIVVATELPCDAVYEILTRVSLDAFVRQCRWVCKDWRSLCDQWDFRKLHHQRTQTISGYFIQKFCVKNTVDFIFGIEHSPPIMPPTLNFLPCDGKLKIMASSNLGLLCCAHCQNFYACKPTTKEWKQISNPEIGRWSRPMDPYISCGLHHMAMVVKKSEPLHYRILGIVTPSTIVNTDCLLYQFFDSQADKWNVARKTELLGGAGFYQDQSAVLFNGAFHWPLRETTNIIAIDVDTENWTLIRNPKTKVFKNKSQNKLVKCRGKLAMLYYKDKQKCIDFWELEDYESEVWKRKHHIDLQILHRPLMTYHLVDLYNVGILIIMETHSCITNRDPQNVIWFDYRKNTFATLMKADWALRTCFHYFESDSVPCKLGSIQ